MNLAPPRTEPITEHLARHMREPARLLLQSAVVVLVSVLFTVVLYSYILYRAGVLFEDGLKNSLPQAVKDKYVNFEGTKAALTAQLSDVDALLEKAHFQNIPPDYAVLVQRRQQLELELAKPPQVVFGSYFLSSTMLLWPAVYSSLGILVFTGSGFGFRSLGVGGILRLTRLIVAVVLISHSPMWLRNFVIVDEGRRIYASANWDVSKVGYVCQETIYFGMNLLLCLLWTRSMLEYQLIQKALESDPSEPLAHTIDPIVLRRIGSLFLIWIIRSVVLAAGFLIFTIFYWNNIFISKDYRYVPHALIVHTCWVLSWLLLTLPLALAWYRWHSRRLEAMAAQVAASGADSKVTESLKALQEINPINTWGLAGSGALAAASLVLPLLRGSLG